jgi:hypothetical protein
VFSGPNPNTFQNISTNQFEAYPGYLVPDFVMTLSNRLAYWMFEPGLDRIIDFVLLEDTQVVDVNRDLIAGIDPYNGLGNATMSGLWRTNRQSATGPTDGILQQMNVSLGYLAAVTAAEWREYAFAATPLENDKLAAINGFRNFMGFGPTGSVAFVTNDTLAMQAPFNPAAKLAVLSTWQANDPLVHYHPEDLRIGFPTNHQYLKPTQIALNVDPANLGVLNTRYSPWNGNPNQNTYPEGGNLAIKDAGINESADWRFPSNKLATVGLLGRVHRGTPWQSIHFKSDVADSSEWSKQSADAVFIPGRGTVSRTHPINDLLLLDMFTTGLDERTSRGLVSVNQTNLETWSALFGGILVLSNNLDTAPIIGEPKQYEEILVRPYGGVDPSTNGFFQIWTNIYRYQLTKGAPLEGVGEIIRNVPELTSRSPFLNLTDPEQIKHGLDDFAFEQIPQQIVSLLRVGTSRFVIYAYGQALKPERIDPSTGVAVNYQVTAEFATRTVVRVEGDPRSRVRTVVESFNILPPD